MIDGEQAHHSRGRGVNTTLPAHVCPLHLAYTHNGQCTLSNYLGSPSGFEHLGGEARREEKG